MRTSRILRTRMFVVYIRETVELKVLCDYFGKIAGRLHVGYVTVI